MSAAQVAERLFTVYDFADLLAKPILLRLIKDTILLAGENVF